MHSWACPCQGPTPWGRVDAPQMSRWVWKFSISLLISLPTSFVKKNYPLKCITGLALVGVLPLGQGGCPPDVRVGLEILQITTYIISSKFC